MASITFQNMQSKLLPVLSKDIPKFLGQGNYVAVDVEEIPVRAKQGVMPFDLSNIAYNLQNDYGGTALGYLLKSLPNPKAIPFKIDSEDFYMGYSEDYIEDLAVFFEDASADKGKAIVASLAQKMAARANLIRERNLAKVVSNSDLYGTVNTIDMTADPISTWSEAIADTFFKNITELTQYMNKATGGNLWDKNMTLASDVKFHIVIPFPVWKAFQGVFRTFNKNYITVMGFEEGKYKAFRPDLFNAITGGITQVGTAYMVDPDAELGEEYRIKDLKDIWTQNEIYLFTSSSNITYASSVKELVFKAYDLKALDILGDQIFKSRIRRTTIAANPMAFTKIKVAL